MLVGVVAAVLGIFLFSMYNRKKKVVYFLLFIDTRSYYAIQYIQNAKDLERSLDSLEKGVEEETPKQEMGKLGSTLPLLAMTCTILHVHVQCHVHVHVHVQCIYTCTLYL